MIKEITILFDYDRDTKLTRRFTETAVKINGKDEPGPSSGMFYIQQWALKQAFGDILPDAVVVTIKKHESTAYTGPGLEEVAVDIKA